MTPSLELVDYLIILAYMVFALGVGIALSKKASQSSEDYFLGGRSLPWWMVGISMVATSFASDTPLVTAEIVRKYGVQRLWWVFVAVLTLICGIFLFSRLWRRAAIITDAEFYELRYDGNSAVILRAFRAFFGGIIQNLITIGWVTFAMSRIITTMTDFNEWWAIAICMAVALVYSTSSGFYGVVVTDLVQFFLATFSMLALAAIAIVKCGGLSAVLETIVATPGYGEKTLAMFPDFTVFDLDLLALVIFVCVIWWGDANGYNMQRMSACKNERHAVKATIFYAIFQAARPWLWVGAAFVSIVLFPNLDNTEYTHTDAYPLVMNAVLGPGLRGLLVASFLAAFMSTIDTHLNWGASYMMTDVYQRFIKKDASQRHYMFVTRIVVVALMAAGACIVPFMESVEGAWIFLALIMAGSGMIHVARWFWWRINAYTEITALILGLCSGVLHLLLPETVIVFGYPWPDLPFEIRIALVTAVIVPISLIVTFLTPPVSTEKLEAFYRKIRPGGFWGPVSQETRNLPGKALRPETLIDIAAGCALSFGISLTIGYSLLMNFTNAGICALLAVIGAIRVRYWYKKEIQDLSDSGFLSAQSAEPPADSV